MQLGFPTFSYGGYAQDQGPRGKVIDFRVPLEIGGVRLEPGDLIFGDLDGVCIIPRGRRKKWFVRRWKRPAKRAFWNGRCVKG